MIKLYIVADRAVFSDEDAYFAVLAVLARSLGGYPAVALQVRAKEVTAAARVPFVERVREAVGEYASRVFLNGTAREALAAGFGGVHWPETLIPQAPGLRPLGFTVGASVHSLAALKRAETAEVDFVLFGPVFDAGSKPVSGVGVSSLAEIVRHATVPVLAIGGVTPRNVPQCIDAGASGVAAVTGIVSARDPAAAVADYLTAIEDAQRHLATNALTAPVHVS